MMLQGEMECDGLIDGVRCAGCWGTSVGLSAWLARAIASMPTDLSRTLGSLSFLSRAGNALDAKAHVHRHEIQFNALGQEADRVVAVCQWLYDALLRNGIPEHKLVLSRQGLSGKIGRSIPGRVIKSRSGALRIGFLGRWDSVKGLHVLVDAVRGLPESIAVKLVVYAIDSETDDSRMYQESVRSVAGDDSRISFSRSVRHDEVAEILRHLDVLAVPSLWMETGPMVVLEAFGLGIPVLGSNVGGIKELVEHGVNGLLVSPFNAGDWTSAIISLAENPDLLRSLRSGIEPVRTMRDVADDMAKIYRDLL
jgi:glycosyltransferase involved in cell wall biosynthesis